MDDGAAELFEFFSAGEDRESAFAIQFRYARCDSSHNGIENPITSQRWPSPRSRRPMPRQGNLDGCQRKGLAHKAGPVWRGKGKEGYRRWVPPTPVFLKKSLQTIENK